MRLKMRVARSSSGEVEDGEEEECEEEEDAGMRDVRDGCSEQSSGGGRGPFHAWRKGMPVKFLLAGHDANDPTKPRVVAIKARMALTDATNATAVIPLAGAEPVALKAKLKGSAAPNPEKLGVALDAAIVYASNAAESREALEVIDLDTGAIMARQPWAIARISDHQQTLQRLHAALVDERSADRFRSWDSTGSVPLMTKDRAGNEPVPT